MFDIGWTELVIVAIVAILVVGPKDLPGMLRGFGRTVTSLRKMARDFQKQFDDALREAELDEVRNSVSKPFKPLEDARKSMESYQTQVRDALKGESPATGRPSTETTSAKTQEAPDHKKAPPAKASAKRPAAAAKTKPAAKTKASAKNQPAAKTKPATKTKPAVKTAAKATRGSGSKKSGGTA